MSLAPDLASTSVRRGADGLPAWPILVMLWGFPAMWLLGVTVVPAAASMTGVMVAFMVQQKRVVVVPGVGAFVGFAVWILPTALMLDNGARALGYLYRLLIIVFALVAFLYTLSAHRHLRMQSVVNALTFVWAFVVIGGNLGMLFPHARITTPVGMILPASLTSNAYVHDLFFLPLAEVQHPWGSPLVFVRPSAPFPYANSWGSAILILTPVAVACFMMTKSWRVRAVLLLVALALVPPAMATSNRAMFAGLGLAVVYIIVRMSVRNRAAPALGLTTLATVTAFFVMSQGLLDQIGVRQQYGQSNDARFTLYGETLRRTLESPVLGYGGPRPSVAQELSVGTQGYVWTLMFSHGFVGLALFLLFLWGTTIRTWRVAGEIHLVMHTSLVVASLVVFVYGLDIMQMLALVLVSALLLRRRYGLDPHAEP
jgi:hypothetical protein